MKMFISFLLLGFALLFSTKGICSYDSKYFVDITSSSRGILLAVNEKPEIVKYNFEAKKWESLISTQDYKSVNLDPDRFVNSSLYIKDKLIFAGYDGILIYSFDDNDSVILPNETPNSLYRIFIAHDNQLIIVYHTGKVIVITSDDSIKEIRELKSSGI